MLVTRELEQMKLENAQMKREVVAVAAAVRNATPAEVNDWLLRPTTPTHHTEHPLPRGRPHEPPPGGAMCSHMYLHQEAPCVVICTSTRRSHMSLILVVLCAPSLGGTTHNSS